MLKWGRSGARARMRAPRASSSVCRLSTIPRVDWSALCTASCNDRLRTPGTTVLSGTEPRNGFCDCVAALLGLVVFNAGSNGRGVVIVLDNGEVDPELCACDE